MSRILQLFLNLRALMLIASFGALAGSGVMYWIGAKYLLEAVGIVHPELAGGAHLPAVLVLEAMDAFLFAIVLTIFAYGIAVGFVLRLEEATIEQLPDWMKVTGIGQLKHTLAEVVLIILIVTFTKDVVEAEQKLDWNQLILPIAVVLFAGALWLLRAGKPH
ncbi:MAG: YqhA family protein [Ancalomicrobiaceae bacterium]|nr:YqhA family protein [Ancalomicrobiaceae bacterium]